MRLLIKKGVDVKAKSIYEHTALYEAVNGNHATTVQLLMDNGAVVNEEYNDDLPILQYAILKGYSDVEKTLINGGADINAKSEIKKETALMCAASKGDADIVKLLIEKGANIYAKSNEGMTALDWAEETDQTEIIEFLEACE